MNLQNVKEIRISTNEKEVNSLLGAGWFIYRTDYCNADGQMHFTMMRVDTVKETRILTDEEDVNFLLSTGWFIHMASYCNVDGKTYFMMMRVG